MFGAIIVWVMTYGLNCANEVDIVHSHLEYMTIADLVTPDGVWNAQLVMIAELVQVTSKEPFYC